jgi:predicted transcriptional regulator
MYKANQQVELKKRTKFQLLLEVLPFKSKVKVKVTHNRPSRWPKGVRVD